MIDPPQSKPNIISSLLSRSNCSNPSLVDPGPPSSGATPGFHQMLDINLFRKEKGNDPERVRESQRKRGASVDIVDQIILLDEEWRLRQFELDGLRKNFHQINKDVARCKLSGADATELVMTMEEINKLVDDKQKSVQSVKEALASKLGTVGNLVHQSVPVGFDEKDNVVLRTWGERRIEDNLRSHVDLVELAGIADLKRGCNVAGSRGYYLKEMGVRLRSALIRYSMDFLRKRNYELIHTPLIMRKDIMEECAQLSEFHEELYKVNGNGAEKYLIATSEQPLCAYHRREIINPSELPLRYASCSTCFRREAGSHGRDTRGLFRLHEFTKTEQFCITSPDDNESWDMLEKMMRISEELYQELKLPYRVVSIASADLNDAAAKKIDLEAWFPASKLYRELVSCSNCTDYQSRKLGIRFGQKKLQENGKTKYVHLLNCTQTAVERTMCCFLENFQRKDGVEVPKELQSYLDGMAFIPFINKPLVIYKKQKDRAIIEGQGWEQSKRYTCPVAEIQGIKRWFIFCISVPFHFFNL